MTSHYISLREKKKKKKKKHIRGGVHGRQSSEIPHKEIDKDTDPLRHYLQKIYIIMSNEFLLIS